MHVSRVLVKGLGIRESEFREPRARLISIHTRISLNKD
jgi:hypothetical protein